MRARRDVAGTCRRCHDDDSAAEAVCAGCYSSRRRPAGCRDMAWPLDRLPGRRLFIKHGESVGRRTTPKRANANLASLHGHVSCCCCCCCRWVGRTPASSARSLQSRRASAHRQRPPPTVVQQAFVTRPIGRNFVVVFELVAVS